MKLMKVLITGVGGPRGRQLAGYLHEVGHQVVGVGQERWPNPPSGIEIHNISHRKRRFEDLMRHGEIEAICHLGVHAGFRLDPAERHRLNLEGTQKIIALAAAHSVRKLIFASHASVYGALPDNPCFMTEEFPPSVGRTFPEMQDLVTADLLAGAAMWQHPSLEIVVLRPVHSLGPTSRGVIAGLLRRRYVPRVMGFDPMIQVIHEHDVTRATAMALADGLRGVFNVVGPGELPLSVLLREVGCTSIPVPSSILPALLGHFGLPDVSAGALDFLKHPCLIDGRRFAQETGFVPEHNLVDTVRCMRH